MSKLARNDPCPCGSGKKYKQCCLIPDQDRRSLALKSAQAADERLHDHEEFCPCCYDELLERSQAVAVLVRTGKLDEAQRAAEHLIGDFPDLHEGYDRLGMVHEARGDRAAAVACYQKVLEFIRATPEQYEPNFDRLFEELIKKLDSHAAAS